MFIFKRLVPAFLCLTAFFGTLSAQTRNVFVLPPAGGTSVQVYNADTFSPVGSFGTAPAPFLVISNLQGTKYYVISKSASNTVIVLDSNFNATGTHFSLGANADAAALSPDGKRLVVLAGGVHLIDTTSDTDLTPNGLANGNPGNPTDLVISQDSTRAFVLSKTLQQVTAIDLVGNVATNLSFPFAGSSAYISIAPNGLLYVSAINRIFQVNPTTMQQSGEIDVTAYPNKLFFTPDGHYALLANDQPVSGSTSLILVDLTTKQVTATLP
jgi:Tol biopolymer transport system component